MKLMSMAQKSGEGKEETAEIAAEASTPKFPYGLCLCLNEEALEKLGWKDLPKVGAKFNIEARGVVTAVRSIEGQEHSTQSVDIQLTDLGIDGEKAAKSAADTLYPNTEGAPRSDIKR